MTNDNGTHRHHGEALMRPVFMTSDSGQQITCFRPGQNNASVGRGEVYKLNPFAEMGIEPVAVMPFGCSRSAIPEGV